MNILFIGDIVGRPGRTAIKEILPNLKKKEEINFVIANGENLSHGKGMTVQVVEEMRSAGIDFFTSGNHIWKQKSILEKVDDKAFPVIRPANYPPSVPGRGYEIAKTGLLKKILVINLIGRVFLPSHFDCPFRKIDEILEKEKHEKVEAIIVDFHAEATSEKVAMQHYLDGRVSAVLGTHTHVPTADAKISSLGTASITDVGMVGLKDSIIGIDKKNVLKQFLTQIPTTHEISEGETIFNAVLIKTGSDKKTIEIKQIII